MKDIFKNIKLWFVNTNYKIDNWFYEHSVIYIASLNIRKCYYEYNEAKNYFLKPYWLLTYSGKKDKYLLNDRRRILFFNVYTLGWKMKFDDPVFEYCPKIQLGIFNHLWEWELVAPTYQYKSNYNTHEYWQPIIQYLWGCEFDKETKTYKRNICNTYQEYVWARMNYTVEDNNAKKWDRPISVTKFYIDNILTTVAKAELREHGIKMHNNGIETIICEYDD